MNKSLFDFDVELHRLGKYQDLLFTNGWLLSSEPIYFLPDTWKSFHVFGYQLSVGKDAYVEFGKQVVVVGEIFDCLHPQLSNSEVVARCDSVASDSFGSLIEMLEYCNGNYTLICNDSRSGDVRVLNDATGMSGIYHDITFSYASSHSLLIALNISRSFTVKKYNLYSKFGFPGRFTPYVDVLQLNPSSYLSLSNRKAVRYNLLNELVERSLDDVVGDFSTLMKMSVEAFSHRKDIVMSLTAGFDSRTALAACKGINNIELFTYYRADDMDTDRIDVRVAQELCRRNNLKHEILMLRENTADPAYLALCSMNAHYRHIPAASYNYYRYFGDRDVYHLRSNLSEIGRAFYSHRFPTRPETISVDTMLRCYVSKATKERKNYAESIEPIYREIFSDYLVGSEVGRVHDSYDYRDVFYWEHRMGAWHAQVVAESSPAFVTVSAYNSSAILKLMLSLSFKRRKSKAIMEKMIELNWPELMGLPVNPKRWPS